MDQDLKPLLLHVVTGLAQHHDEIRIAEVSRPGIEGWDLRVAEADFPRVIGRQGRTARALRCLMETAYQGQERPLLNIVDPEDDGLPVD